MEGSTEHFLSFLDELKTEETIKAHVSIRHSELKDYLLKKNTKFFENSSQDLGMGQNFNGMQDATNARSYQEINLIRKIINDIDYPHSVGEEHRFNPIIEKTREILNKFYKP